MRNGTIQLLFIKTDTELFWEILVALYPSLTSGEDVERLILRSLTLKKDTCMTLHPKKVKLVVRQMPTTSASMKVAWNLDLNVPLSCSLTRALPLCRTK